MKQITKKEYQKYSIEMLINIVADELSIDIDKLVSPRVSSIIDILDDLRNIYTDGKGEKFNRFDFLEFAESSGYDDKYNNVIMTLFEFINDMEDKDK